MFGFCGFNDHPFSKHDPLVRRGWMHKYSSNWLNYETSQHNILNTAITFSNILTNKNFATSCDSKPEPNTPLDPKLFKNYNLNTTKQKKENKRNQNTKLNSLVKIKYLKKNWNYVSRDEMEAVLSCSSSSSSSPTLLSASTITVLTLHFSLFLDNGDKTSQVFRGIFHLSFSHKYSVWEWELFQLIDFHFINL